MQYRRLIGIAVLVVASAVGVASAERWVVVNGQRLTAAEIQYLEQATCTPIPNGAYWVNVTAGVWGYAGNPFPQGEIEQLFWFNPHTDASSELAPSLTNLILPYLFRIGRVKHSSHRARG